MKQAWLVQRFHDDEGQWQIVFEEPSTRDYRVVCPIAYCVLEPGAPE